MIAKQVSKRGGDLRVQWLKPDSNGAAEGDGLGLGRVALQGEVLVTMKGELYL